MIARLNLKLQLCYHAYYSLILYIHIVTYLPGLGVTLPTGLGVSKPMADSRPKGLQLRLGHPRVGELHPLSPLYGTRPCCLV